MAQWARECRYREQHFPPKSQPIHSCQTHLGLHEQLDVHQEVRNAHELLLVGVDLLSAWTLAIELFGVTRAADGVTAAEREETAHVEVLLQRLVEARQLDEREESRQTEHEALVFRPKGRNGRAELGIAA